MRRLVPRGPAPGRPPAAALPAVLALAFGASAAPLAAQSSLGVQGFGYPAGQFSTRAQGTGGALGEFDPVSVVNPTSLLEFGRTFAAFQYDPEFRSLTVRTPGGSARQNNTVARFPIVAVGAPVRRRFMVGLSASTLLDRTFTAEFADTARFSDGTLAAGRQRVESNGSIADVRLAGAMQLRPWLRVGLSGHVFTGENRLVSARQFDSATVFSAINDSTSIDYTGAAATLGLAVRPVRGVQIAGSYRAGGTLKTTRNDSTLSRANAPDRAGVALRVDRVTGAVFAVAFSHTSWSRMRALGTRALDVRDATELNGGVEALGPRLGELPVLLRLGGRQRTLPFGVGGARIRETSYGGGLGLPLGGGARRGRRGAPARLAHARGRRRRRDRRARAGAAVEHRVHHPAVARRPAVGAGGGTLGGGAVGAAADGGSAGAVRAARAGGRRRPRQRGAALGPAPAPRGSGPWARSTGRAPSPRPAPTAPTSASWT
jgi:hypothetical protein